MILLGLVFFEEDFFLLFFSQCRFWKSSFILCLISVLMQTYSYECVLIVRLWTQMITMIINPFSWSFIFLNFSLASYSFWSFTFNCRTSLQIHEIARTLCSARVTSRQTRMFSQQLTIELKWQKIDFFGETI